MKKTGKKPVSVGETLAVEFMRPLGITQVQLAKAMGVSRRTVNELCTGKRSVTAESALMLATVFSNPPEYWLDLQRQNDLWQVLHSEERKARISQARPISEVMA